MRLLFLLVLLMAVEQSLSDTNRFGILVFGGWRTSKDVRVYSINSQSALCTLKELPRSARESPFASIIDGNITICGGGLNECYALTKNSQQWITSEGVSRERASAITTFDGSVWTFFGGKSDLEKATYSVWTKDTSGFSDPNDLDFDLGEGACSVRFNQSHAIISRGSDNVYWYWEEDFKFELWSEKGGSVQIHAGCGLVNLEDEETQFVLAGGQGESEEAVHQVSLYDFGKTEWHEGQKMPLKMYGATSVQIQNTFINLGGHNQGAFFSDIYYYNAEEGWTKLDRELEKGTLFLGALHVLESQVECS